MVSLVTVGRELSPPISARTLSRAALEGSIRARGGQGRGHHYVLDDDEAAYLRVCGQTLFALRDAFRVEPGVQGAILFGSSATGHVHAGSDIDLVVDLGSADDVALAKLEARLRRKLKRPVDLYHLADLRSRPEILSEIQRTGRPIVERSGIRAQLQRLVRRRQALPR